MQVGRKEQKNFREMCNREKHGNLYNVVLEKTSFFVCHWKDKSNLRWGGGDALVYATT